jgi:hypothetical protein
VHHYELASTGFLLRKICETSKLFLPPNLRVPSSSQCGSILPYGCPLIPCFPSKGNENKASLPLSKLLWEFWKLLPNTLEYYWESISSRPIILPWRANNETMRRSYLGCSFISHTQSSKE